MDTSEVTTLRHVPNVKLNPNAIAIHVPTKGSSEENKDNGARITYDKLSALIGSTASFLKSRIGVDVGDVVSIVMPNTVPFVLSFLGVTWCRAVAAPLNPNYTEAEYKFYMEDAGVKLLLLPDSDSAANDEARKAAEDLGMAVYTISWQLGAEDEKDVTIVHKVGAKHLQPQLEEEAGESMEDPAGDDIALFLHTSGTTARPKGVPLAHRNLTASIANIILTYSLSQTDATLLIMPLFHVHGLMAALLATLSSGGTVVLPPEGRFSAGPFWTYIQEGNVTWYTGVPTMHQILLGRFENDYPKENPPTLRFIRSCSSSLAPAVLEQIETKFGQGTAPCLEAYAMTEAAHQMCSNPMGDRRAGTVGKGTGVEIVIMSSDGETPATEPGVVGEVCIRGPNVFSGYNNVDPKVNVESFKGGFFHTGDQGLLDEEGYLTLTGRIKELINRGGEKISPLEVDAAMLSHKDVTEAVSFAVPDEKYGEDVGAAIVLRKDVVSSNFDLEEFKLFLSSKISKFKIPVKIFVAEELPKTATGKIQRRIVAAHFLD